MKERVCFFCGAKSGGRRGGIFAATLTSTGRIYTHAVCLGRHQARLRKEGWRKP